MRPRRSSDINREQRRAALAYFMFLKRTRCGRIKRRGCAEERPQRAYIPREDATSPTVSTQALFLTCIVDAHEGRDVATVDIPGAFMQADMDDLVHLRLTGKMVDFLLEIDREAYAPFITHEGKEKVVYVELVKALYGTLKAAKLFWLLLSGKLQEWGFHINGYDSCVGNKTINDKQCTIIWHVDGSKISHVDSKVIDGIRQGRTAKYPPWKGPRLPLYVSRFQLPRQDRRIHGII
jgi:hypothetical protein